MEYPASKGLWDMQVAVLDAARKLRSFFDDPPSSVDALFVDDLFVAAELHRDEQAGMSPLVYFTDVGMLIAQGPLWKELNASADRHAETELCRDVGLLRDLLGQTPALTSAAMLIEPGLYVRAQGVHYRDFRPVFRMKAVRTVLQGLGFDMDFTTLGRDVGHEFFVEPATLGWRHPAAAAATLH